MCFADSSVNVEIEESDLVTEQYKCIDCKTQFRGIGKKIRCPSCQSDNVTKV